MFKLDLHLSFSEVVWDTLLVLWIVRLASKLYSSGWHVLHLGVRFQVWERLAKTGRPNRIRILLFLSVAFQDRFQQKISFFLCFCALGTFTSFFKDDKSLRSHKRVETKGFLNLSCLFMEGSGSVQNNYGFGSWRLKNLRLWIRKTAVSHVPVGVEWKRK